jgi:hypothetical protein
LTGDGDSLEDKVPVDSGEAKDDVWDAVLSGMDFGTSVWRNKEEGFEGAGAGDNGLVAIKMVDVVEPSLLFVFCRVGLDIGSGGNIVDVDVSSSCRVG